MKLTKQQTLSVISNALSDDLGWWTADTPTDKARRSAIRKAQKLISERKIPEADESVGEYMDEIRHRDHTTLDKRIANNEAYSRACYVHGDYSDACAFRFYTDILRVVDSFRKRERPDREALIEHYHEDIDLFDKRAKQDMKAVILTGDEKTAMSYLFDLSDVIGVAPL